MRRQSCSIRCLVRCLNEMNRPSCRLLFRVSSYRPFCGFDLVLEMDVRWLPSFCKVRAVDTSRDHLISREGFDGLDSVADCWGFQCLAMFFGSRRRVCRSVDEQLRRVGCACCRNSDKLFPPLCPQLLQYFLLIPFQIQRRRRLFVPTRQWRRVVAFSRGGVHL